MTHIFRYCKIRQNLSFRKFDINVNYSSKARVRSRILEEDYRISPAGWSLLIIPVTTFGLGYWQVQRKQWKINLLTELNTKTKQEPIELPNDLDEINFLEYSPIKVRGVFDHNKEILLGPRNLLIDGSASTQGSILTNKASSQSGYIVITPFTLSDRNITILVNRGWIPMNKKNPQTRLNGQIENEVELIGIVRLNEKRSPFMPENKGGTWYYRDLNKMARLANSEPIYLDATYDTSRVSGGPIGGQTRITLRNEHMSYIITWFSLSAATAFMWFNYFIRKKR